MSSLLAASFFLGQYSDFPFFLQQNFQTLSNFVTESGKIIPRKLSGLTKRSQIKITHAIKRARNFGGHAFFFFPFFYLSLTLWNFF